MGTTRKLIVEVIDARNLLPKDGHGSSSPYAVLDYHGQRRKTRTVIKDLSPIWNETIEFNVSNKSPELFGDALELDVFHDKNVGPTTRNNFLGRVRLGSRQFVKKGEEALIYYALEKKSLFSWIQGEIGLKIYFVDEEEQQRVVHEPREEIVAGKASVEGAADGEMTETPSTGGDANVPPGKDSEKPSEELKHETDPSSLSAAKAGTVPNAEPSTQPHEETNKATDDPNQNPPDQPFSPRQAQTSENIMSASVASAFVPQVKLIDNHSSNMNAPKPISRVSSVSSFLSEQSEVAAIERSTFDLVDKMHYLFVRVVKARYLCTSGNPVVKIAVSGCHVISRTASKTAFFDWDQIFAFNRDAPDSSPLLEISVWGPTDPNWSSDDGVEGRDFLGGVCFDVGEIPLRDPPDSPLAPQWYRLEGSGSHRTGDLMLATWVGTQADESFPDAWKMESSSSGNSITSRSKVYQSPKLWYLRASIIESQDISMSVPFKDSCYQIKAQLGFQVQKTKPIIASNRNPSWKEDLLFVASEPFTESDLTFYLVETRKHKEQLIKGVAKVPLTTIERRVDDRNVVSKWFSLEHPKEAKRVYKGRLHLRLCFDGGYHVMDEAANLCSDYRPTARQLWKPPIGTIELGIIGCKNLLPMKTMKGKGSTDAYVVAKYGNKWIRTRTISDNLDPRWNEQYTWRVYDPSTILNIGVFDSWEISEPDNESAVRPDLRIGKVRIRISTLSTGKAYRNTYPLLLLSRAGLRKTGEIELAVRFVQSSPTLDFLHVYSQPLLPIMHNLKPINMVQQEALRSTAVKLISAHLSRSEPPLRPDTITYILDTDSNTFSMRRVRANWYRIVNAVAGLIEAFKWLEATRSWKNPTATLLVHALLVTLVWFPDLAVPTLAFYVFAIGAWNYRWHRSRASPLPHFDPKMSLAEAIDADELDEEFDAMPCSNRASEVVRVRYDRLRMLGTRFQILLGDVAAQVERVQALVAWRDPRATGIFVGLCFLVGLVLYLVPMKMVAMASLFYYMRHPMFRDRFPSPAINFLRRLPSLGDRML